MKAAQTLQNKSRVNKNAGFTLVEIMVSVTIFALVMTVSMGAILTIVNANRKAQSLKSVMNNLNFALENLTRTIKTGGSYSVSSPICDSTNVSSNILTVGNAVTQGVSGNTIKYSLVSGQIQKQINAGLPEAVTAPEITIERFCFYVTGNTANDGAQPKVTMILKGFAGDLKTRSYFNLQTTVSQRLLDS